MPRPSTSRLLARLGDAIDDLIGKALDVLVPGPEPRRIPVRVRERR